MIKIDNKGKFYEKFWEEHQNESLGDFSYKWPAIKNYLPKNRNITILDFGCGTGIFIGKLKEANPQSHLIGIDISREGIKQAKKKFPDVKFHVVQDGQIFPLIDSSVDFILATDVIEHVYETDKTLAEFYRILKPNGKLLLTTPYHGLIKNLIIVLFAFEKIFDPLEAHIRFYTKKSLFQILKKQGFEINKYGRFGRFYPFSRAVFVIAHKTSHSKK